jgi:hypothetical protein
LVLLDKDNSDAKLAGNTTEEFPAGPSMRASDWSVPMPMRYIDVAVPSLVIVADSPATNMLVTLFSTRTITCSIFCHACVYVCT